MSAVILDGKALAAKLQTEISARVCSLMRKNIAPKLAVVAVGNDNASEVYRKSLSRVCFLCKIEHEDFILPETTSEAELLNLITRLSGDGSIHGILLQTPLPKHINQAKIALAICPDKDVDAANPVNIGKIICGKYDFMPCTPLGVAALFDHYGIDVSGRHCVIIGRSVTVGKPMAMLMLSRNATVTVCHSVTRPLAQITRQADILITAAGQPEFITADMIKDGCIIADVGMNRNSQGALCGDVNFLDAVQKAAYISPVPGGVGALTVTMLMSNVVKASEILNSISD